mmetsp:Transcript_98124/g.194291  ORF Transcript_98124/g.194291 Transcript_98124/m.194291 type:complete len:85 (-) Transcript_98124:192-446(-)
MATTSPNICSGRCRFAKGKDELRACVHGAAGLAIDMPELPVATLRNALAWYAGFEARILTLLTNFVQTIPPVWMRCNWSCMKAR